LILVGTALAVGLFVVQGDGGLMLAAVAGATGGTLSGARALRDATDIRRARSFQAWWWVQPAVGAAVGLFVYALLNSTVLSLPGSDASVGAEARGSAVIVYAFLAGFSEPFVLGVLDRITRAADVAADAAASPPRDATTTAAMPDPALSKPMDRANTRLEVRP
jgi:hypothetical protein